MRLALPDSTANQQRLHAPFSKRKTWKSCNNKSLEAISRTRNPIVARVNPAEPSSEPLGK
jgi:hypothetical protein